MGASVERKSLPTILEPLTFKLKTSDYGSRVVRVPLGLCASVTTGYIQSAHKYLVYVYFTSARFRHMDGRAKFYRATVAVKKSSITTTRMMKLAKIIEAACSNPDIADNLKRNRLTVVLE